MQSKSNGKDIVNSRVKAPVSEFVAKSNHYFEYVPTSEVDVFKEFDREVTIKFDKSELDTLTRQVQKNGITAPLDLEVYRGHALLVEGNHRLAVAKRLGIKFLPLRVTVRSSDFGSINKHRAVKINTRTLSELMAKYPEVAIDDWDSSPAHYGFTKIYPTKAFKNGGLIAPNGQKSNLTAKQYKLVRTPEFKAWFGDWENDPKNASKIVDENGEPLVVYHGSGTKNIENFDSEKSGSIQYSDWGNGIYFTPHKSTADYYSNEAIKKNDKLYNELYEIFERTQSHDDLKNFQKRGRELSDNKNTIVYPVFLNMRNPLEQVVESMNYTDPFLSRTAIEKKNDGIIILNGRFKFDELLVFDSKQIKLADGSNKTFDANKPDIRFADGGPLTHEEGPTDFGKVISASSRFKPSETIIFEPALMGNNGNKLVSYSWAYEFTMLPNHEGELVTKRISDWTQAEASAETGRGIVHKYGIDMADGTHKLVSSETVPIILGFIDDSQKKAFGNIATASKTLAKQEMKLAIMEAQKKEYDILYQKYEKSPKPPILIAEIDDLPAITKHVIERMNSNGEELDFIYFKMDSVVHRQHFSTNYNYKPGESHYIKTTTPNKDTINQLELQWISSKVKENGGINPKDIYDMRNRVARQKKKISQLLSQQEAVVKVEQKPDTVTANLDSPISNNSEMESTIKYVSDKTGIKFTKSRDTNSWYGSNASFSKIRISDHPSKFVEKQYNMGFKAIDLNLNHYAKEAMVHILNGTDPFAKLKSGDKIQHASDIVGEVEYVSHNQEKESITVKTRDGRNVTYFADKFLTPNNAYFMQDSKEYASGGTLDAVESFAEKVKEILKGRGIDENYNTSKTDYGVSSYFHIYENNNLDSNPITFRISDHSVANRGRMVNEVHVLLNSSTPNEPIRVANNMERLIYPERYVFQEDKEGIYFKSGKRGEYTRSFQDGGTLDEKENILNANGEDFVYVYHASPHKLEYIKVGANKNFKYAKSDSIYVATNPNNALSYVRFLGGEPYLYKIKIQKKELHPDTGFIKTHGGKNTLEESIRLYGLATIKRDVYGNEMELIESSDIYDKGGETKSKGFLEKELDKNIKDLQAKDEHLRKQYYNLKLELGKKAVKASQVDLFGTQKAGKLFDDTVSLNEAENVARKILKEAEAEIEKNRAELTRLQVNRDAIIKADKSQMSMFSKGGNTEQPKGDCYKVTGVLAINNSDQIGDYKFIGTPYVIHAEVTGQGSINGIRYGHAWIEDDIYAYDYSNGFKLMAPKALYHKWGNVKTQPGKFYKYTFREAKEKMYDLEHYGPWDLETESGF